MIRKNSLLSPASYAAPGVRVFCYYHRGPLCASVGGLNPDDYGSTGSAGKDVEEDDGGSLF